MVFCLSFSGRSVLENPRLRYGGNLETTQIIEIIRIEGNLSHIPSVAYACSVKLTLYIRILIKFQIFRCVRLDCLGKTKANTIDIIITKSLEILLCVLQMLFRDHYLEILTP